MKLTPDLLKSIIMEEVKKMGKKMKQPADVAKSAPEVDADGYADSLENHFDMYKALGLEEARLVRRLGKIREAKASIKKKI